jgi:hypothetical protein
MSAEAGSFAGFDVHLELTRLLWCGAAVLAAVLYLFRIAA